MQTATRPNNNRGYFTPTYNTGKHLLLAATTLRRRQCGVAGVCTVPSALYSQQRLSNCGLLADLPAGKLFSCDLRRLSANFKHPKRADYWILGGGSSAAAFAAASWGISQLYRRQRAAAVNRTSSVVFV